MVIKILTKLQIKKKKPKAKGKKTFHPITINWSNLYLGTLARIKINIKETATILIENINSGSTPKKFQPPKNKIMNKADIKNIFEYSPKKKVANKIPEYSIL